MFKKKVLHSPLETLEKHKQTQSFSGERNIFAWECKMINISFSLPSHFSFSSAFRGSVDWRYFDFSGYQKVLGTCPTYPTRKWSTFLSGPLMKIIYEVVTFMTLSLLAKLLMMDSDSWKRELPVTATSAISWLTAMMI